MCGKCMQNKTKAKIYLWKPMIQGIVGLLFFGFAFWGTKTILQENKVREYRSIVEQFTPSTVEEVIAKADKGDNFYIFVGVSTCPDCQAFARRLDANVKSAKVDPKTIYYIGFDSVRDFRGFSEESFDRLTKDTEGVPLFRKVYKGRLQKPFDELDDLIGYLLSQ